MNSHLSSQLQDQRRRFEWILFILFLVTLPVLNPWVRGDGVGYYAYARAPLIEHNLDFTHDYQSANKSFREARWTRTASPRRNFAPARATSTIILPWDRPCSGLPSFW